MTQQKPILVVGATGRHGGTGAAVAHALLAQGSPVRALVRKVDERTIPLQALGAELIQGDLHDRRSLAKALEDVEAAYFTYPISAGVVDAAANFAAAGRSTGLKRVVVMSMAPAHPESPSHLGRAQWLAEEILQWAGFSCLHLRIAAVFFENIEMLHRDEIESDGVIRNSFADIPVSWIAAEDAAGIAAVALLHPERFEGQTAIYPGAERQYTQTEIAEIIGRHLGRPIRHETISKQSWQERIVRLNGTDARVGADMAAHISAVAASLTKPFPPNDIIASTTGRSPMSLEEMLGAGKLRFGSPIPAA
jgi:uncharacterized protein YbjT (DUF2867 family)